MNRTQKVAIITFTGAMIVLVAMLWMPNLAGPDGLERTLYDITGDDEFEPDPEFSYDNAPFPDYEFQNFNNSYIHNWIIGLFGSIIVFITVFAFFKLIILRKKGKS